MSESHAPRVVATHVEADGRILITVEVKPEFTADILGTHLREAVNRNLPPGYRIS